ncbi:volume-regulated anion channel subunit LRRC8C-like isoform X2 [Pseudophryne corroboree]|uniref:volume-regulated anion channel subunit LRRC8C-like isoform X2 n=1 Tax=Pseudophryne corroboree TaxID=495146 RepID=UPI0030821F92
MLCLITSISLCLCYPCLLPVCMERRVEHTKENWEKKMLCTPIPPSHHQGSIAVNLTSSSGVQSYLFPSRYKTELDFQYYLLINQWCYDNVVLSYSRFFPYLILTNSMIFLITSNFWFKFPGTSSKIDQFISCLGKCLNSPWTIKALSETVYEQMPQLSIKVDNSSSVIPSASMLKINELPETPPISQEDTTYIHFEEAEKPKEMSNGTKTLAGAVVDTGETMKILDKKEGEQAKALFEKVKKFRLHTEEKDILYSMYKRQTILRLLEATAFMAYVSYYTPRMKYVVHCVEPLNITGYTNYYCIHSLWRMFSMLSIGYLFVLCIYTCICFYTVSWIFYYKLKEYSFETIRKESGIDDIPDVTNDFAFLLHLIDQYDKLYSWKFAVFLSDVSETKLLQVNLNHYWNQEKLKQCLTINSQGKTELRLCRMPGIPTQVFDLVEIEVLKLDTISSTTLTAAISNLRLLKELWVTDSKVNVETQALIFLQKNIEILRVNFSKPDEVPSWMYNLSCLQELYISGRLQLENKITIVLQPFKDLTQLKFLSLKLYTPIIPPAVLDLVYTLRSLTIHNETCKLSSVTNLKKFTNLINLRLLYCQLDRIPSSVFSLVKLQNLDLSNNSLSSLVELASFQQLKNLVCLRLSNNKISAIPPHIAKLASLEILYISRNQLTEISVAVFKLTRLSHLDVSNNEICILPTEIGQLVNLEYLSVSHNRLTSLPNHLFSCIKLQTLILSHNHISVISPLIGELIQLTYLDIMDNKLEKLPAELEKCSYLKRNQLLVEKEVFDTLPQDVKEKMKTSTNNGASA